MARAKDAVLSASRDGSGAEALSAVLDALTTVVKPATAVEAAEAQTGVPCNYAAVHFTVREPLAWRLTREHAIFSWRFCPSPCTELQSMA